MLCSWWLKCAAKGKWILLFRIVFRWFVNLKQKSVHVSATQLPCYIHCKKLNIFGLSQVKKGDRISMFMSVGLKFLSVIICLQIRHWGLIHVTLPWWVEGSSSLDVKRDCTFGSSSRDLRGTALYMLLIEEVKFYILEITI